MFKYRNDMYDLCSGATKRIFECFCNEINMSKAEVFVVMAHKAVRLFQILIDQKHIASHVVSKTIVSSHALDFDSSYLSGKKIAIVDDILISGTSIASTVHKLIDLGAEKNNISIIALAIDKRYQSMSFSNEAGHSLLHCDSYLDDSECIELSYTISKFFSYYGISYDVDYPNYTAVELDDHKTNMLYQKFFWDTDIISNEQQKKGDVDFLVLFPNNNVQQLLWERIGKDLGNVSHLKIRIYITNFPSGKRECYIVPMCLFNEIAEADINELYDLYKPKTKEIVLNNDAYISKIRYLQFYISHQLYLVFKSITNIGKDTKPNNDSITALFGVIDGTTVLNDINTSCVYNNAVTSIKSIASSNENAEKSFLCSDAGKRCLKEMKRVRNNDGNKSFDINRIICMPFLWWYDTKEIPVRIDLANNQYHFIKDYATIENKLKRLNSGFSLNSLKNIFKDMLVDYEIEHLISLFLDRAIDEGIIVPTVCHDQNNHCLYRAYRHGEDLPFALQDECRLLRYILGLNKYIPNINISSMEDDPCVGGVATISFEKMVVLFYQMGIERGDIFNRFLGFDNTKLLKPFLSMHGTVEGFVEPEYIKKHEIEEHFYSEALDDGEEYITWLTKWLCKGGFIEKKEIDESNKSKRTVYFINSDRIDTYLNENERSCTSKNFSKKISNISNMIAIWYNFMAKGDGKDKFKKDAIALTSCSNYYVYASAIATENHYFFKFFNNQIRNAFENTIDPQRMLDKLVATKKDKERTEGIKQGLNSGRDKVEWFNKKRASKVVQEVAELFEIGSESIWRDLWESILSYSTYCTRDLKTYINQAVGYLYFYSACYDCLMSKEFWEYGEKPVNFEKYKDLYEKQCEKTILLKKGLFDMFDEVLSENDFAVKKEKYQNIIARIVVDSEDAVKNIEGQVRKGASNYTVRYRSALIFEVNAFQHSQCNSMIMNMWNQLEESVEKTQLNIVEFPINLCNENFIRYGIFYGNSSYKNNNDPTKDCEMLADIYKRLCDQFDGKVYEIRAMMILNTPPGRMFEHNIQKNITFYIADFAANVTNDLEKYYESNTKQQMVLAMTDFVDPKVYEIIKKIKWDNQKKHENEIGKCAFPWVKTYYNNYIGSGEERGKESAYSIVMIVCGGFVGAGLMLKTQHKVLCITCNHLLRSYPESIPQAIFDYENEIIFELNPIKDIKVIAEGGLISAREELAILEVQLQGRIPIDMNRLLSLSDLQDYTGEKMSLNCICCGYPEKIRNWSDTLKVINVAGKGYWQTKINKTENAVDSGYSGGVIVLEDNPNYILGIHEGRDTSNDTGRMIPCGVIIKEVEELNKKKYANNS